MLKALPIPQLSIARLLIQFNSHVGDCSLIVWILFVGSHLLETKENRCANDSGLLSIIVTHFTESFSRMDRRLVVVEFD